MKLDFQISDQSSRLKHLCSETGALAADFVGPSPWVLLTPRLFHSAGTELPLS